MEDVEIKKLNFFQCAQLIQEIKKLRITADIMKIDKDTVLNVAIRNGKYPGFAANYPRNAIGYGLSPAAYTAKALKLVSEPLWIESVRNALYA